MFVYLHLPAADALGGLAICSSLGDEFRRNYRREVLLGRRLAEQGIATVRFHYRGYGSSQGDPAEASLDTMIEDAREAVDVLRREVASPALAYLGTRWGGLVAAAASRSRPEAPLALWDPAVSGATYVRELVRVSMIRAVAVGDEPRPSPAQRLKELDGGGVIDVLGHRLDRRLYASAQDVDLREETRGRSGPLLVAALNRRGVLPPRLSSVIEDWRRAGVTVDTSVVDAEEQWWFLRAREQLGHETGASAQLLALTAGWLAKRLGEARPS